MSECPICKGPLTAPVEDHPSGDQMLTYSEFYFRITKGTGEWVKMDVCAKCGDEINKRQG